MVLGGFPIGGAPIGGAPGAGSGAGTGYEFWPPPATDPTTDFRDGGGDVPADEYGTYHSWLIPEPDSPLTIGWVECIGLGVARCMLGGQGAISIADKTVTNGVSNGTTQLTGQNAFAKIPFTRVYFREVVDGSAYYQDHMIGPGNAFRGIVDGRLYFLDKSGERDSFAVEWGKDNSKEANTRLGTWIIVANGR